ncbi:MAG: hypothetical protein LPK49_07495 [Bacteroidota bacterium]|nr:hypothetical protein [Bacteroidota bacterium]
MTYPIESFGIDKYFATGKLIAPVYRLKGDSIESYLGFGIDSKEPLPKYPCKVPKFDQVMDTGYTFLYSKVSQNAVKGYTAVLVANYGRRHLPAVLYVDHNNNFDFTDDGEPDTFYLQMKYLDIAIENPENPVQKVVFRLSRFDFTKDLAFKRMAVVLFQLHSGTKQFVGTSFSFREQRFNIRKVDCVVQGDSFQVAVQDVNYNGIYNEPGIDRILLNAFGDEVLSTDHVFAIEKKNAASYFERNFKSYRVVSIDSFGRSITFAPDPEKKARRQLLEGKKAPNLKFTDARGNKHKLRWYRRKPVYVYFWNRESPEFEEDTAALRMIQEKFCPMLKIIALNYGDNPKMLPSYVEVNGVHYVCGVATKSMIQQYQLEEIPYGFLLKRRNKLYKKGLRPTEILQMLEDGTIQSW